MAATEPERWLVADDEVAHQLRPALRMARGGGPSASEHARMWDGLALKLAVGGIGDAECVDRAASASPELGSRAAAEGGGRARRAETALGNHPGWWWIAGTAIFAAAFGFAAALFVAPSERTNVRVVNPPLVGAQSRGSQSAEPPSEASQLVSASSAPLVTAVSESSSSANTTAGSVASALATADAAPKSIHAAGSELRAAGLRERAEAEVRPPTASGAEQVEARSREGRAGSEPRAAGLRVGARPATASGVEQVEARSREGRATTKLGVLSFRPPQRSAANAGAGGNIAGELDLLARARRVVATNPARALQLTAEHARRFQDGVLAQEREVLAIDALSRLGHRDVAAARARRFIQSYPDSAHRARLIAELEEP